MRDHVRHRLHYRHKGHAPGIVAAIVMRIIGGTGSGPAGRAVMVMIAVVTKMLSGGAFLILAIPPDLRPGRLERDGDEKKE